jgi:hypothetical protein
VIGDWSDPKVRSRAELEFFEALDARMHIAALGANYWLGSVFLDIVGLDVPADIVEGWATYGYSPTDVLRLCLSGAMWAYKAKPPNFMLQIQPDAGQ